MSLTQARLKALLDYDPDTGVFTWRERADGPPQWNTRFSGTMAGSNLVRASTSYRQIRISPRVYSAHRLAWLWMTGYWPKCIDHRDCDGLDNRWDNLRECTRRENQGNRRVNSNNSVGIKGVYRHGHKYSARISIGGVSKHLGTFETAEAAHAAYFQKAVEVFGEFARGKW